MKNYFDLSGRVALVTGASTGLGVQMAKALANQGCSIVCLARRKNLVDENAAALEKEFGVKAIGIACDITDTERMDSLIGEDLRQELVEQIELLDGASYDFDLEQVRNGRLSPVFFGSALNNFGVEPFLENFLKCPCLRGRDRRASGRSIRKRTAFRRSFSRSRPI